MGKIGRWLGFHFINREQLLTPATSTKSLVKRESSNGDIHRHRPDTRIRLAVIQTKSTSTTTANLEEQQDESTTHSALQQHSLTYNIEQILLKMQTQFDPSRIDDENLKISILREILECQRLLLTIHARKQNVHTQSLFDIYEEWKILAIIVDRICFIFYLVSMLAASIIFFVREPILKQSA